MTDHERIERLERVVEKLIYIAEHPAGQYNGGHPTLPWQASRTLKEAKELMK